MRKDWKMAAKKAMKRSTGGKAKRRNTAGKQARAKAAGPVNARRAGAKKLATTIYGRGAGLWGEVVSHVERLQQSEGRGAARRVAQVEPTATH